MVGALRCDSLEVNEYAKQGAFPDSVTSLIDDERRAQFKAEGRHIESTYYISLTYLPPMQSEEKVKGYLFKGGAGDNKTAGETALIYFKDRLGLFHDVLSSQVRVERLWDIVSLETMGRRQSGSVAIWRGMCAVA